AFATGEAAPKPKASARRKKSGSDTFITPTTATTTLKPTVVVTPRLTAAAKGKQTAKILSGLSEPGGSGTAEGTGSKPRVPDVPTDESEEELSWNSSDDEGADDQVKDEDDDEGEEGDKSDEGEEDADEDKDGDERDDDEKIKSKCPYCSTVSKKPDEIQNLLFKSIRAESLYVTKWAKMAQGKDGPPKSPSKAGPPFGVYIPSPCLGEEVAKFDDKDDTEKSGDDDEKGSGDDDEKGSSDEEDNNEETKDEESFDPIPQTPESSEDEGDGEEDQGLNISEEERLNEEEEADELYRDVDINQGRGLQVNQEVEESHVTLTSINSDGQQESSSVSSQFVTNMLNPTSDAGMESIFVTASTSVAPLPITAPIMTPSTITTITTTSQAPIPPTPILSEILQNLPTFDSVFRFDDRLWSLEQNFSEVIQTTQFAGTFSAIPKIVQHFMDQRMNEAVQVAVRLHSDRLREEAQKENDEFLRTVDENIKKIIKKQFKDQVKAQVSKILPMIEQAVNEQLEAEVLTRSSHSSRTSYAVAAELSKMELKKILIEKMEGNKSIQRSDAQRNLYNALVDAYESDKIILDTYGETVTLKRRRNDDEDKDEEPSAGPDRGSKRRREGKEPESASTPSDTATKSAGRSTTGSKSRQASASESVFAEEPVQTTSRFEEPSHPMVETGAEDQPIVQSSQHPECELAKQADSRSSFNELLDTPLDFSNFIMNRLRVDTLALELLVGPTYELMKGSCTILIELEYHLEEVYKATTDQLDWVNPEGQQYPHNLLQPLPVIPDNRGRHVIPFAHFINNDLEYLRGCTSSRKYTTSVTKTKAADYGNIKWIEDLVPRTMWIQELIDYDKHAFWGVSYWGRKRQQFYGFAVNRESALDVYSKRRIIAVTDLKIVEWHSYKHLDWISVRRDDDKIYKFKEGDLKRLRLQDIKDMMFTRSIVIQRRVEDLQLGVESYQKRLNLTKPDTMQYLPQTIWRKCDKDREAAMIQAIDKMLKTRRIMRNLEKFVGGRLYEGDFRMLQRTI
nr:hypothetical protein [Tanacetum cinerariifolium]